VSDKTHVLARSRSLWDADLPVPIDELANGEVHQHTIAGPAGASLFAVEWAVILPESMSGKSVRAVAAVDRAEINAAANAFARDLLPYVALLAIVLLVASWAQVTIGLNPLTQVKARLAEVREGSRRALGPGFPDEVRPLATEVDLLLEEQEVALSKARARAADLAHGLRTSLTVLQGDAEELKARGQSELAEEISDIADSMSRHIERELARARAGSRSSVRSRQNILPIIDGVVGVVRRLPSAAALTYEIDVASDLRVNIDPQDLAELIGNLVENATKWATSRIRVRARRYGDAIAIFVEDDGPGIPDAQAAEALSRGGRLDEKRSGTGLGLAIVRDLVEIYGGSLKLAVSSLGGLEVEVRFA
jgi:signal transduction histidine kinase